MSFYLKNIKHEISYKILIVCSLTVFPIILSAFTKDILSSYLYPILAIIIFKIINFKIANSYSENFITSNIKLDLLQEKFSVNLLSEYPENKNLEIDKTLIELEKLKKSLVGIETTIKELDNLKGIKKIQKVVIVKKKMLILKKEIDGKVSITFQVKDQEIKNILKKEPLLKSDPEKLYQILENRGKIKGN